MPFFENIKNNFPESQMTKQIIEKLQAYKELENNIELYGLLSTLAEIEKQSHTCEHKPNTGHFVKQAEQHCESINQWLASHNLPAIIDNRVWNRYIEHVKERNDSYNYVSDNAKNKFHNPETRAKAYLSTKIKAAANVHANKQWERMQRKIMGKKRFMRPKDVRARMSQIGKRRAGLPVSAPVSPNIQRGVWKHGEVEYVENDCLAEVHLRHKSHPDQPIYAVVAANPTFPGGAFFRKTGSQEEAIFHRTNTIDRLLVLMQLIVNESQSPKPNFNDLKDIYGNKVLDFFDLDPSAADYQQKLDAVKLYVQAFDNIRSIIESGKEPGRRAQRKIAQAEEQFFKTNVYNVKIEGRAAPVLRGVTYSYTDQNGNKCEGPVNLVMVAAPNASRTARGSDRKSLETNAQKEHAYYRQVTKPLNATLEEIGNIYANSSAQFVGGLPGAGAYGIPLDIVARELSSLDVPENVEVCHVGFPAEIRPIQEQAKHKEIVKQARKKAANDPALASAKKEYSELHELMVKIRKQKEKHPSYGKEKQIKEEMDTLRRKIINIYKNHYKNLDDNSLRALVKAAQSSRDAEGTHYTSDASINFEQQAVNGMSFDRHQKRAPVQATTPLAQAKALAQRASSKSAPEPDAKAEQHENQASIQRGKFKK